ncbi:MAG: hypothetical protein ACXVJW_09360 [Acidimicrobiia bacterium]
MTQIGDHWEEIYATRRPAETSWYQREPVTSLRLIAAHASPSEPVVDVGGGASSLVDCLLRDGFIDITVLDVSGRALNAVAERLGGEVHGVDLIRPDCFTPVHHEREDHITPSGVVQPFTWVVLERT